MFKRPKYDTFLKRIQEPRKHIQVISGPRQVGKTTLIKQVLAKTSVPTQYASADKSTIQNSTWLNQQRDVGMILDNSSKSAVLVLDEIQKNPRMV